MTEFFSCNDNTGRYIFNIVFFSLIGALVILFIVLAGYLLYKRHKKEKKRRLLYRSRANTANTTCTMLSGAGGGSQLASNFIIGRPPATDVVLGVYGDEISKNARTAFYEEKGWRGFAYWKDIAKQLYGSCHGGIKRTGNATIHFWSITVVMEFFGAPAETNSW